MEHLPLEILRQILSFLTYKQRLDAGLVCKRWLYATRILLEDVVLEAKEGHLPHVNSGRYFTTIHVQDTAIDDYCVHFINYNKPLHLKFTNCEVQKSLSTNIDCDELLSLETDSSELLSLFEYSPSLEKLTLSDARNVNAETLQNCEFIGLGLKSFSMHSFLNYSNVSSQNGQEFLVDTEPILLSLENFVRMKAETLKFVDFPINVTAEAVLSISRIENLKLESVTFSGCDDCGTAIFDFCQNQPSITALHLYRASSISSDKDFHKIFDQLPALREFSVADSSTLDSFVVRLFTRRTMSLIDLRFCHSITPNCFSAAITKLACKDLCVLGLDGTQLQESHILRLLPLLPRLNKITLSSFTLSNDGFREATLRLTSLRTLELFKCNGLSGNKLGHLTGLVKLWLFDCKGVTREGILEGVRFQNLKYLSVGPSLHYGRDDSIKLELIRQNPRLEGGFICIY